MTGSLIWKYFAVAMVVTVVVAMGAGVLTPDRAQAATNYYVDPIGTDDGDHGTGTGAAAFNTIQYAVNDARVVAGDTINVAAGTYVEQVQIIKSLTLAGAGEANTTIKSPTTPVDVGYHSYRPVVYVSAAGSGTTIQNLKIDGDGRGSAIGDSWKFFGICFGDASGTVDRVTITGVRRATIDDNDPKHDALRFVNYTLINTTATITNCTISNYGKNAITVNNFGGDLAYDITATISYNSITGNGPTPSMSQNGIQIYDATASIHHNNVQNNAASGCGGSGNCDKDPTTDPKFDTAAGIYLYGSRACSVYNNTLAGNSFSIWAISATSVGIHDNTINAPALATKTAGISVWSIDQGWFPMPERATSGTINSNTITGADYGILIRKYDSMTPTVTAAHNSITGNTLYGAWSNVPFAATNNWWGANDGPGAVAAGHGDKVSANVTYDPWLMLNLGRNPASITANGASTSAITADMTKNSDNVVTAGVPDGTTIGFTTTSGSLSKASENTVSGIAAVTLTSSTVPGIATVTAAAPGSADYGKTSSTVTFKPGTASTITFTAVPDKIIANGTSTSALTATLRDPLGNPVADGTDVVFTTDQGAVGSSTITKQTTGGVATATLTSIASTQTVIADVSAAANGVSKMISVFFAPPSAPPINNYTADTVSGSGTITGTATGGSVTVDGTGSHTVTTVNYGGNPGGAPSFNASGNYYDVHIDSTAGLNSMTIQYSPATAATIIYYWTGTAWKAVSNQTYAGGVVTVTITATTFPTLADLSGLFFGSGTELVTTPATPTPAPLVNPMISTLPTSHGAFMPAIPIPQAPIALPNVLVKSAAISGPSRVTAEVTNSGTASGSSRIVLSVDGKPTDSQVVSLAPGNTITVSFDVSKLGPGAHTVAVNNVTAGSVSGGMSGDAALFVVLTVLLALICGLFFYIFRRKRA